MEAESFFRDVSLTRCCYNVVTYVIKVPIHFVCFLLHCFTTKI